MTVKLIQMLRCTRFAILQSAQSRMQFRPILNHALQCNVAQGSMDVVQRRTTVCLYKELQDPLTLSLKPTSSILFSGGLVKP